MSRVSAMEVRPPSEAPPAHVTEAPPLWRQNSMAISHQRRNSESGLPSHPTGPGKPPSLSGEGGSKISRSESLWFGFSGSVWVSTPSSSSAH
jgi:hypothetical protein